jgi:hypothetical protein
MLIPLGILAGSGGVEGDFELIETIVLTGTQTYATFSNVDTYASTYKHLQIRSAGRTNASGSFVRLNAAFGSPTTDFGSNYAAHYLYGYNNAVASAASTSRVGVHAGMLAGSSAATNVFGSGVCDILDAFSTTKNKTVRSLGGVGATGTAGYIELQSGFWNNTAQIETIELYASGASLLAGSRFSLYGIKGE